MGARVPPLESASLSMAPLRFAPLSVERWRDLERLFGERGGCGGCWCMYWRLKRSVWQEGKEENGAENKQAFRRLVGTKQPLGVIAYAGAEPVGWCAVGPRETLPALERSRVLSRVDGKPVWSVSCFYVDRRFRRRGVSVALLKAAVEYAGSCGAALVEGYPIEPRTDAVPPPFAWTGIASAFRKAGFREVARRSPARPILRRACGRRRASGTQSSS